MLTSTFAGTARTFQTLGRVIDEDVLQSRVGISGATAGGLDVNLSYFREDTGGHALDGLVGTDTYRF